MALQKSMGRVLCVAMWRRWREGALCEVLNECLLIGPETVSSRRDGSGTGIIEGKVSTVEKSIVR